MIEYFFYALLILGTNLFFKYFPIFKNVSLTTFIITTFLIILLSITVCIILNLNNTFVKIVTIVVAVAFQNKLSHRTGKA